MIVEQNARQSFYDALAMTVDTAKPCHAEIESVRFHLAFAADTELPHLTCALWRVTGMNRGEILLHGSLPTSGRAAMIIDRLSYLLPLLVAYHRQLPFAGEVCLGLEDYYNGPGLAFCSDGREGNWLIPDIDFIGSRGYKSTIGAYAHRAVPWSQRSPRAFWRGSTTGLAWAVPYWRELPRLKLCDIGCTRPDLFDVGISSVVQIEPHAVEIEALGLRRSPVPSEHWIDYRYQIDVDGNSNAWAGYFQRLLTGSPVLKVASPHGFCQWFYDRMKPWHQFVPIEADMSDLIEKLEWLNAHESVALLIGKEGGRFARSLRYDDEISLALLTITSAMSGKMEAPTPKTVPVELY